LLLFYRALNSSQKFSFIETERMLRNLEAISGEPLPAVKHVRFCPIVSAESII
jgi:hypothetical protein